MNKRFVIAIAVAAACFVLPAAASSWPVVASAARLSLRPAVGPPTTQTKAKGVGYQAGETVAIFFDGGRIASAVADSFGKFVKKIRVSAAARPGAHTVEAVGGSSGLSARAVFLVRTDWLQGCFEAGRSCFNNFENVLKPSTVGRLALRWRTPVGADGLTSPAYANGKVFAGGGAGLYVLDPATGGILVICKTGGPVVTTPAVIRGFDPQPDPPGKVIFGSSDGNLYAMSTSGGLAWQVMLGAAPSSPLVLQKPGSSTAEVVVGAGATLFALDQNGRQLWQTRLEGGDISKPPALVQLPGQPQWLIVSAGNMLHELDAQTGALLWSNPLSRGPLGAPATGNPRFIGNPNILVGDQAGMLFSIDPASGRVKASFQARGPISGSPAVGDPNLSDPWVSFGDGGGNIYAIDTVDAFPPPIWQATLGGPVDGSPVLANHLVYAATDPKDGGDPHLYALDQATGRVLFETILPGGVASSPTVTDGKVIVATKSGDILGYQTPDT